jgi:hypothetical protein
VPWFAFMVVFVIVAALLAVMAAAVTSTNKTARNPASNVGYKIGASFCIALALLMAVLSTAREVPSKSVGVPTTLGKVGAAAGPGVHFGNPFRRMNILDETVQTTTFEGCHDEFCQGPHPEHGNCLEVRIGGQQTACLDVTFQWRIRDSAASELFNNYNHSGLGIMSEITNAVVIRELKQVVNNVLGDYQPIQDVAATAGVGNSQFSTFGHIVYNQMQADIGSQITIFVPQGTKTKNRVVLMPLLRYDGSLQGRLNQVQAQFAETAIAKQQLATNEAQAAANAALLKSVENESVLKAQCLQIIQAAQKAGYRGLPATLNCGLGNASQVAIPAGNGS